MSMTIPLGFPPSKSTNLAHAGVASIAQANQGPLHHIPCKLHSLSHASSSPLHRCPSSHAHYHAPKAQSPINMDHSQSTRPRVTFTRVEVPTSKIHFKTLLWHGIATTQADAMANGNPLVKEMHSITIYSNWATLYWKHNSCSHVSMPSQMFPEKSFPPHVQMVSLAKLSTSHRFHHNTILTCITPYGYCWIHHLHANLTIYQIHFSKTQSKMQTQDYNFRKTILIRMTRFHFSTTLPHKL